MPPPPPFPVGHALSRARPGVWPAGDGGAGRRRVPGAQAARGSAPPLPRLAAPVPVQRARVAVAAPTVGGDPLKFD